MFMEVLSKSWKRKNHTSNQPERDNITSFAETYMINIQNLYSSSYFLFPTISKRNRNSERPGFDARQVNLAFEMSNFESHTNLKEE